MVYVPGVETAAQYGLAGVVVICAFSLVGVILKQRYNSKNGNGISDNEKRLIAVIENNTRAFDNNTKALEQNATLIRAVEVSMAGQEQMLNELLAHARKN